MIDTTPAGWFTKLTKALAARQTNIDLLDDYYTGAHPFPYMGADLDEEVRRLHKMCRANWCELVVNAAADSLRVVGIRRGDGTKGLNAGLDVWKGWWQPNCMDKAQRQIYRRALSCERSFAAVWPQPRLRTATATRPARITVESPRQMIVAYKPGSTTDRGAALKSFFDDGWCYQCLWLGDRVYTRKVKARSSGASWSAPSAIAKWEGWWLDNDPADPMTEGRLGPFGDRIPVVEFAANPNDEGEPTSDLAVVIPAQDRINEALCNRVFVGRAQAYPDRVLIGEPIRLDPTTGQPINPLKKGPERVNQLTNKDAKIDSWDAADLTGFIGSIRSDIMEITSLSRTPPNITIAELANIGADALRALKESHNAKILAHQDYFADPMEEVIRLAMAADNADGADDDSLETIWSDPDAPSLGERGEAVSKMGKYLPKTFLFEIAGLSPQGVEDALAESELQQSKDMLVASVAAANAPKPAVPVAS